MTIEGRLENYDLAEILLGLSMNQQTGTLKIFLEKKEKQIYFHQGAIFVIYSREQNISEMEKLLVSSQRATAKQFKTALKSQLDTQRFIGDVLLDMKILSHGELVQLMFKFIEDTLFEIYLENKGKFVFEHNKAPENLTLPLPQQINLANSHVLECLNKMGEWSNIRKYFPTLKEIYIFTQDFRSLPLGNLSAEEVEELKWINGQTPISQILEKTLLSQLRMLSIMTSLIEQGYLRQISLEEAMELAKSFESKGQRVEALAYYEFGETLSPENPLFYHQHATLLESLGHMEKAVEAYKHAADLYFNLANYEKVLQIYMKILSFDSANIGVLEKLFDAYLRSARKEETLQMGQMLGNLLLSKRDFQNAILVYSHLVKLFPREIAFRRALASCYQHMGETDLATQQYNIARRMEMEERRKKKEKVQKVLRKVFILGVLLLFLGSGYLGWKYFEKMQNAKQALNNAKEIWNSYEKELKSSPFLTKKDIENKYKVLMEAWKKASQMGYQEISKGYIQKLENWRQAALLRWEEYEKSQKDIKNIEQKEKIAYQKGDFKKLFELRLEKYEKFKTYLKKKNIELPLVIQVSPQDAQVWINGKLAKDDPKYSTLYYFPYDSSISSLEVEIKKEGYGVKKLRPATPKKFQNLGLVFLLRQSNWTFPSEGGVFQNFLQKEGMIYWLTRKGYLYNRSLANLSAKEDPLWRVVGEIGEIYTPMMAVGDFLCFANSKGEIIYFHTKTDTLNRRKISNYPFRSAPILLKQLYFNKNIFAIGGTDGFLYVLEPSERELKIWQKLPLPDGGFLGRPKIIEAHNKLYLLAKGYNQVLRLYLVNDFSNKLQLLPLWGIANLENSFGDDILFYNDLLFIPTVKGELHILELRSANPILVYSFGEPIRNQIQLLDKNKILVSSADLNQGHIWVCRFDKLRKQLKVLWKKQVFPVWANPAISQDGSILYVPSYLSYREHRVVLKKGKEYQGRILASTALGIKLEDPNFQIHSIPWKGIRKVIKGRFKSKGFLYAFNLTKQMEMWRFPVPKGGIRMTPLLEDNQIIFANVVGEVINIKNE